MVESKKGGLATAFVMIALAVAPFVHDSPAGQDPPVGLNSGYDYQWDGGGDGRNWTDPLNWNLDANYPSGENDTATFASTVDEIVTSSFPLTIGNLDLKDTFAGRIILQGSMVLSSRGDENGAYWQKGGSFEANGHDIYVEGDWLQLNGSFMHGAGTVEFKGGHTQNISSLDPLYSVIVNSGTTLALKHDIELYQIHIEGTSSLEVDAIAVGKPRTFLNFTDQAGCGFTVTTSGYINLTGDTNHRPTITSANDGQPVTNGWEGRTNAKWQADYAVFRYMKDIRSLSSSVVDIDFSSFNLSKSGTCYAQETPYTLSFTNNSFGSASCIFYTSAFHGEYDNITKDGPGGITVFGSNGISEFHNSEVSFDLVFFTGNAMLSSRNGFNILGAFDIAIGKGVHYLSEIVSYPPRQSDSITIHSGSLVIDRNVTLRNLYVGHINSDYVNLTVEPGVQIAVGEAITFRNGYGASIIRLIGNETHPVVLRSKTEGNQSRFWLNTPRYFFADYVDFKDIDFSGKMGYAKNSRSLGNCDNLCIDCVLWFREEMPAVLDDTSPATFKVSYFNAEDNPPAFVGLAIEEVGQWHVFRMRELNVGDTTYTDTKEYALTVPLEPGVYSYYYIGDNGTKNETTPAYTFKVVRPVDGHYRLTTYNGNRSQFHRDIVRFREASFLSTMVMPSPDGFAYTTIGGPNLYRVHRNDSLELIHSFAGWSGTNGLLVTTDGIMFVSLRNTSAPYNSSLFRSADYGSTWQRVGPWNVQENFGFDVDDRGGYYFANYSQRMFGQKAQNISVYKSSDKGLTWRAILNVTTPTADHMHIVRVDPYVPGSIWATHGDDPPGNGLWHSSDYGKSWEFLLYEQHTAAVFDEEYVFFGQDNTPYAMRAYDKTQDAFFYTHTLPDEGWQAWTAIEYTWHMTTINGVFWQILTDYGGGKEDGLWASWDGFHWVMVDHFGPAFPRGLTEVYGKLYLSFNEGSNTRIYEMMSKEDIMELYFATHPTNETLLHNGSFRTGHTLQPLSHYVIENPRVRFRSHPVRQFIMHPDMEHWSYGCQQNTGPCGWSPAQTGIGNVSWARDYEIYHSPPSSARIINTNAQEAYYVMHSHPSAFGEYLKPHTYYTFSFWVKANKTYPRGLCWEIHWIDEAGNDLGKSGAWCPESLTTNWTRYSGQHYSMSNTKRVQIWWYVLGKYLTVWTDDWSWTEGANTTALPVNPYPGYSNGTLNTGNISYLRIGPNVLSYSESDGVLSNSSYTTWISSTDRVGGFIDFSASVETSGISDYQITGDTVLFVEDGYVVDYDHDEDKALLRIFGGQIHIARKVRVGYLGFNGMDVLINPTDPLYLNFTNWSEEQVAIEYNSTSDNNVSFLVGRLLPLQNYTISVGMQTDYTVTDASGYLVYNFSGSGEHTIVIEKGGIEPPSLESVTLSGQSLENLTLIWSPSPDEAEFNITEYRIYRTNGTYDRLLLGYQLVGTIPLGTNAYNDAGAGLGDNQNYFYGVCAITDTNLSTCAVLQGGKFIRPLGPGFQLISVPLLQSDYGIESVLQTVVFERAWSYDSKEESWLSYMKSKTYLGSLLDLGTTDGLWVEVSAPCDYVIAGIVPLYTTIELSTGWNLIGVPSFLGNITVSQLKAETPTLRVEGYSSLNPPSYLKVLADSDRLFLGFGYWVYLNQAALWTITNY